MDYIIDYSNINKKLSHLKREEIENLISRYYAGEKIKDLAQEFNLGKTIGNIHTFFPIKVYINGFCPYCDVQMISNFKSRYLDTEIKYCPKCDHDYSYYCRCNTCETKRQEEHNRITVEKVKMIQQHFDTSAYNPIDINSVDLLDKIYLGALLRTGLSEDMLYIKPLQSFNLKFTPLKDLDFEVINRLFNNNILKVSPYSPIGAFNFEKGLDYYDKSQVCYHINVDSNNYKQIISNLMNPAIDSVSFYDKEAICNIW